MSFIKLTDIMSQEKSLQMKIKANLSIVLILMFFGCSTGTGTRPKDQYSKTSPVEDVNPYFKKYAGAYTAEIKGKSVTEIDGRVEVYLLTANGQAKWMMIKNDGNGGAVIESEQTGTWTATETKISITAGNNSGTLTEDYILQNGIFVYSVSKDRYLKPYVKPM